MKTIGDLPESVVTAIIYIAAFIAIVWGLFLGISSSENIMGVIGVGLMVWALAAWTLGGFVLILYRQYLSGAYHLLVTAIVVAFVIWLGR